MNSKSLVIIISLIATVSSVSLAFYSDNQSQPNFNNYYSENVTLTLSFHGGNTSLPQTFVFHNVTFTLFGVELYSPAGTGLKGWGVEMNGTNYSLSISGIPSPSFKTWFSPDNNFGIEWSGSKDVTLLVIEYYITSTSTYNGKLPPPTMHRVSVPNSNGLSSLSPPPGYSSNIAYVEGASWTGSTTLNQVQVTIMTPESNSGSKDFYYVILSIWDNSNAYDQIGFSGDYGSWGLTWSVGWTNNTYVYNPDAYNLEENQYYTFDMNTNSNDTVEFSAFTGQGVNPYPIFVKWYHTGGTEFIAQSSYDGYYDYTDWEEVYDTTAQYWPDWNFNFTGNTKSGWSAFSTGPLPSNITTHILTSGYDITIANEWFLSTIGVDLGAGYLGSTSVAPGSGVKIYGNTYKAYSGGSEVYLSLINLPSGWTYGFVPSGGSPPFSFYVNIDVPTSSNTGLYRLTMQVTDDHTITESQFFVTVTTSGGGCVAWGSLILTPNGYVSVQDLKPGAKVTEYNLQNGSVFTGTLLFNNKTEVSQEIGVNGGVLLLTLTDQPIYIRNSTFIGWLKDPENLTVGDQLFNPVNNTWVNVSTVSMVEKQIKVFDVVTDGVNDFIDNGFLLDIKT
ncbi:MAG: Hint domain-containing protein [Thermoplasmatales archaeon]|nr:Hint domain-containing protein [Thermoplasmatales archaeon]